MSIITAVIAQAMARQRGLDQETAGRLMVTGYAVGSVASPLTSALVVNQLVQQEPLDRSPTPQTPGSTPLPVQAAPEGLIAGDYVGKPFDEVAKALLDAKVIVERIDVKGSSQGKGLIDKAQIQGDPGEGFQPLAAGDILLPGDIVKLAVSLGVAQAQVAVPDVVGLRFGDAASGLAAFKIERREVSNDKWDQAFLDGSANHVLSQSPAPGEMAAKGSVVLLTTVKAPGDSVAEGRSFKGAAKPAAGDGAKAD